jgi:hypothetical protein
MEIRRNGRFADPCSGSERAAEGGMDSTELLARAQRFALDSLAFYRRLPKCSEAQVPGMQFYRAATSSWANHDRTSFRNSLSPSKK